MLIMRTTTSSSISVKPRPPKRTVLSSASISIHSCLLSRNPRRGAVHTAPRQRHRGKDKTTIRYRYAEVGSLRSLLAVQARREAAGRANITVGIVCSDRAVNGERPIAVLVQLDGVGTTGRTDGHRLKIAPLCGEERRSVARIGR